MRHYHSIAYFLAGVGTKIYDNYFFSYYNQTYQQLFGQFTVIAKGQVGAQVAQGRLPQNLINQWGDDLAQTIATEWLYYVNNMENSPGWNGDASPMIRTSLFNFMSERSTATTIAAVILNLVYNDFNIITPRIELPDTVDYQITNVTTKTLDFTSTFSQQSINNGDNIINFKNAETLLNKYGYQNYNKNPELFLTHLKDGKKLLKDTVSLQISNYKLENIAHIFTNFSSLEYKNKDINNCNKLYQIFDKMGYNNMRYVSVQKQFFKTLEKNDVLNTMKKMGELSEYVSDAGFYHSKILNLIDDYNSNNNDQCLKINNIFKFDKECEELVYKLYSVGVPLSIDKALAVDFVTYNIESLLKADDTLKMLKNLSPEMHNPHRFFSPYASTETIIEALKKIGYDTNFGGGKALENFLEKLVENNTVLKELNLNSIPKPIELVERMIDFHLGREHYQYVCAKPDKNHYEKCLKLQEQFDIEFFGYEIEMTH